MEEQERSDSPYDVDFSVIRTAIDMGHSMIQQILNGIHYGSEEVRNLLYEECDYVVECKVCRNLFRSFPNFVAHKRVYCQETNAEKLVREKAVPVRSEEEAVIVAPEAPTETAVGSSTTKPRGNTVLQQVIDNQFAGKSKDYQFYTKVAENLEIRKATKVTNTVTISAIPSSPHAVMVNYGKGDLSAKSSSKGSPQTANQKSTDTSNKETTSPMIVDDSPQKSTSVANICTRLASKQNVDLDLATSIVQDIGQRQSRRSRKSLPRKSSEECVTFNPAAEVDKSEKLTVVNKSTPASDVNTTVTHQNARVDYKDVEAMDVDKTVTSVSPMYKAMQNSDEDWMKYCDIRKNFCKKCGTQYDRPASLKLHLITIHNLKVGEFKCPQCSKHYMSVGTMIRHMRNNHNASESLVQTTLKQFERKRVSDKRSSTSNSPQSSIKSSPEQSTEKDSPFQTNTSSALYRALTGKIEEPVLKLTDKIDKERKESTATSEKQVQVSVPSKQSGVSSAKNSTTTVSLDECSIMTGKRASRLQKDIKIPIDSKETSNSHVELKTRTQVNDQIGVSNQKRVTRIQKDLNATTKTSVSSVEDEKVETKTLEEVKIIDKPVTRVNKPLQKENEQSISGKCGEKETTVRKKYETRTSIHAKEIQANVKDNSVSAENVCKDESIVGANSQAVDKEKVASDQTGTETVTNKAATNKDIQHHIHSRNDSSDRNKSVEGIHGATPNKKKDSGAEANTKETLMKSFSPVGSPSRLSQARSVPTSPSPSINSNSCDGYSSKFKMTVKEMAELVESTSLAKFAKDRKIRARMILTSTKAKGSKTVPTSLAKPMKRGVRRKLPMKKVYSTRLSTEDTDQNKPVRLKAGLEKFTTKLEREMRRLQNSAGLVEDNIYSSSSPASSTKKSHESDDLSTDSPKVPREKRHMEGSVNCKSKAVDNNVRTLSVDSSKGKVEREGNSRNASKERNEQIEEIRTSMYSLRDKSEDRNSSRNSSVERPKGSVSHKLGDHSKSETIPIDMAGCSVILKVFENKEKPELENTSETVEVDPASANTEMTETKKDDRKQNRERNLHLQIKKSNSLRKKMLAAAKFVNNSKRIMYSKSATKAEQKPDNTKDENLHVDKSKTSDAHNHRTRLATGSIYFNSEILKLSPSKVASMENSPKKLASMNDLNSADAVRRKLSLSPRKDKQRQDRRSEPLVFSLSTGVKKCDNCNKVFWKLKSYKNHKCEKLRKKRMFSGSPRKNESAEGNRSQTTELPSKKARIETPEKGENPTVVRDSPSNIIDKELSKTFERGTDEKEPVRKTTPQKNLHPQPSTSRQEDEVYSDTDSDFSGFSKSDLIERDSVEESDFSDVEMGGVGSDAVSEINDQDIGSRDEFGNDVGFLYKSTGKRRAKSGTVEEIWVEKKSEEKNTEIRQYVRDPNKPSKVHCQSNKDVDKIIDEKELTCIRCKLQFTTMSNLRRHAIRHLGWKRYKCKSCVFTCYDKSECRIHFNRCHGNNLGDSNFLQYYIDLKREASKKRDAKRVTTLRSRKETETMQEEDPYRKPRQTVVVKSAKDISESDVELKAESIKTEVDCVKGKDSPIFKARAHLDKPVAITEADVLTKARMNLSKALKDKM